MSATTKTPVAKLAPIECKTEAAAKKLASADGRKRGILAINEHGVLVVCCRRTAKKNGWSVQEALYKKAEPTTTSTSTVTTTTVTKTTKPKRDLVAEVNADVAAAAKPPKKPRVKKSENSDLL